MTTSARHPLADEWELDPNCIYLNHGSFGPSPRSVRTSREQWSRRLEQQPMRFYCREMEELLDQTCEVLATFLHTDARRLVLVDNATVAMNAVAASVRLAPGDEVLLTNHEYGAVRNIWQSCCRAAGAKVTTATLPFPPTEGDVVAAVQASVTAATRLIVISHVTSATACVLPVQDICRMAQKRRIPVCIDGPHALALLDVRLDEIGCDFYCASGHKWLCGPFGSGFLWVHPRQQSLLQTPLVSWGGSIAGKPASWKDGLQWLGTRDPAPLLSIADAVRFFSPDVLSEYRQHAHELIANARHALLELPGVGAFCTPRESDFVSMAAVELPQTPGWQPGYHGHPDALQTELRDRHGIEVLTGSWQGHRFLRFSAHLYTTAEQLEQFVMAVRTRLEAEQS
ncbi:MAG: aminotransferase class V-fold PLP-dependent enzyme [Planctomycetota bacterium]